MNNIYCKGRLKKTFGYSNDIHNPTSRVTGLRFLDDGSLMAAHMHEHTMYVFTAQNLTEVLMSHRLHTVKGVEKRRFVAKHAM